MKNIIIVAMLLISSFPLFAGQLRIGVEGGYTYTMIKTGTVWAEQSYTAGGFTAYFYTKYGNGHGFDVAVPVEYSFFPWLSIDSGVRYMMKTSTYLKNYLDDGEWHTVDDYRNMDQFIEVPLTVRFSLGTDSFRFFLGGGGYVGIRLPRYQSGLMDSSHGHYTALVHPVSVSGFVQMTSQDARFDAGLIGEAGVSYSISNVGYLYLSARYQYALTSLFKPRKNVVNSYLNSLSVNLGFMFNIGGNV